MKPPGCPMRRVVEIKVEEGGAGLKLDCGHWNWEGGFTEEQAKDAASKWHMRIELRRPCLGACYRYQRPMGIHC
jgi:hypothetical protein